MYNYNYFTVTIVLLLVRNMLIVQTCSVRKLETPEELVSQSHVIVRAKALDYNKPPENPDIEASWTSTSIINFQVVKILKGNKTIPNPLLINGYLSQSDDFNDRPSPYKFIRPAGRHGNCIATTYKQGAQFLLFLNDELTPYWKALMPVNEQLHSPPRRDKWLRWVKKQLVVKKTN